MATISLNIPDAALPRVVDALCARGNWDATKGARNAYAKTVLAQWLKDETFRYERQLAEAAAVAAAAGAANPTPVDIT